jgi:hypothetical protein
MKRIARGQFHGLMTLCQLIRVQEI